MNHETLNQALQVFAVISGFAGSYLVIQRKISAFYWWLASNAVLIAINFLAGNYLLIALYGGYSLMNVWAIASWRREGAHEARVKIEELPHAGA
jgi:nicotinamide riboside transporter PnuC